MRDNVLDSELSALRNSEALFSTCSVSMTGTRLPDERAQAVRSLGSLLNYVRLDPRKGWADSGFHESFAVETVIPSSNEDHTEEYDEDYWKERAIEIAMQDERYSSHSFSNTWPCKSYGWENSTSIQRGQSRYSSVGQWTRQLVYAATSIPDNIPAVPDEHPRANTTEIGSHQSCQPVGQTSIDKDALTSLDKAPSPSIDRRYECGLRAYDIYGARKFRWEQKDEYGVYRDESGYARSVAGEMIPVTKDNIRKIVERASLFEESHICLPEYVTSFTSTKLAPEIYTNDEINEMVIGICGAQEKLGDELKTLHILEKEATTSPSIDANKAISIDVKPQTSQIPAEPESLAEKKDE
ncbi:hypothetical protein F2Q69_00030566 [Brassica cretica]|uniref:Uncharacterized protein n=1 Tax=Brassica cretica TaxID=69181 RepID=A0A8S9RR12_BRACR|nr:hypothetical protein F2Q69_00030566 [Brassica cretica]